MMKTTMFVILVSLMTLSLGALTVYDVQYTQDAGDGTYPSHYLGQTVTVTGIVVATNWNNYPDNFFISDPEGGPWSGVLVYMSEIEPQVGDMVEVTGRVEEYYGLTEISGYNEPIVAEILSSGNPVPAATPVTTGDIVSGEMYEGVFVSLANANVMQAPDEFGQWYVTDGTAPCQIDDGFFYLDSVDPPIEVNQGETWAMIRGMVDYSYEEFGVNPRVPGDLSMNVDADNTDVPVAVHTILGNYPNPFNPETTVRFNLGESSRVLIDIYDIRGRKVTSLAGGVFDSGVHDVVWNGRNDNNAPVSSGIYLVRMRAGDFTGTHRMTLMK